MSLDTNLAAGISDEFFSCVHPQEHRKAAVANVAARRPKRAQTRASEGS